MNAPSLGWGQRPTQANRLLKLHTPLGEDVLLVHQADITEHLSQLPEIELELLSSSANLDPHTLLGQPVSLELALSALSGDGLVEDAVQDGEPLRWFSGLVSRFGRHGSDGGWTVYHATVVPWLALLGSDTRELRVWQHVTCLDVVRTLFEEAGHHGELRVITQRELPRYEFHLQYRESNYALICRLLEQEGLTWWIEYEQQRQIVCIGDHPSSHVPLSGFSQIAFHGDDTPFLKESVTRWSSHTSHRLGDIRYRDYDYHRPTDRLDVGTQTVTEHAESGLKERYDYHSLYDLQGEGDRYSRLAMEREEALHRRHTGESTVRAMRPGARFELVRHFADNGTYLLLQVRHRIRNHYLAARDSNSGTPDPAYRNDFQAQPWETPFRPQLKTPRPQVEGLHTAFVVGPGGAEWHGERMGRIKVWMPFDRRQPMDENASFWVRVSQPSGDADWGHQFYPRIGQEVLLAFHMGDPSLPIAIGGIYNGDKQPRWYNGYINGIKSKEFYGQRHNALVFDDSNGELRTTVHSDEHHSQLHLGHLVHEPTANDRGPHRGNGFELRTDAWGALRAARGMFITTHARLGGKKAVLDHTEANLQLREALSLSRRLSDTAAHHRADPLKANKTLDHFQRAALHPNTNGVNTFEEAALLLDGAAGVGITTPLSAQFTANQNVQTVAGKDVNVAAGQHLSVAVGGALSLFAHQQDMRLIAARGEVKLEAQDNKMSLAAEQQVNVSSSQDTINLTAKRGIVLSSGGAYIKLDGAGNIEIHAPGQISLKGNPVEVDGPASMQVALPAMPKSEPAPGKYSQRFSLFGSDDRVIDHGLVDRPFSIMDALGKILASGAIPKTGRLPRIFSEEPSPLILTIGGPDYRQEVINISHDSEPAAQGTRDMPSHDDDPYHHLTMGEETGFLSSADLAAHLPEINSSDDDE